MALVAALDAAWAKPVKPTVLAREIVDSLLLVLKQTKGKVTMSYNTIAFE